MKFRTIVVSVLILGCLAISEIVSYAQFSGNGLFRDQAFGQSYNNDQTTPGDSVEVLFSFKEYFEGLGHKKEIPIGEVAGGSILFVGGMQIYNKDYWKLPLVYGGIGAGVGLGLHFNKQYNTSVAAGSPDDKAKLYSTLAFAGAGLFYWGSFMDGVISYQPSKWPHAGKATLYSILVPGLGQIYNHEIWKLPLYWGGLATAYHFFSENKMNYERFRLMYIKYCDEPGYTTVYTKDQVLYYRNIFRRYRDYSILALAAVYLIQIIDANVFSYMHNFEVDDNISLEVQPTVISPDKLLPMANQSISPGVGLSVGVKF